MADTEAAIRVEHLKRYYRVHHRRPGLWGALASFVRREYTEVRAVDDISFQVQEGEIVGFLGPNGAGKTTTLKVLSGLLYPTSGRVSVLGFTPYRREKAFLKQITLIMGQKNQLIWDLPAGDTFLLNKEIYEIPDREYERTLAELDELLDIAPLMTKQVRKLSLGERMKCELAAALLHRPRVLFLDEPTIGLDVTMQAKIREFIAAYNQRYGATILLTSHYMADVTALCERVIIIHRGKLLYDGPLSDLAERMAPYKVLTVTFRHPVPVENLIPFGEIVTYEGVRAVLHVPREETAQRAAHLLTQADVEDVTIEDPPIERVIATIFSPEASRS